jgi:hypothetical protein
VSLKPSRHPRCGNPACRERFERRTPWQKVCTKEGCAEAYVAHQKALKTAKAKRDERKDDRDRKEALKSRNEWIKEVQTAFNAFIRFRDRYQPCICCGKPFEPQKPGGSMDAGHYLSRGSSSHLRFNENNVFGQRKNCNRPGGTTRAAFRAGVIARIGLAAVEALEADQTVAKWTIEDLKAMKKAYQAKLKELKKGEGQ